MLTAQDTLPHTDSLSDSLPAISRAGDLSPEAKDTMGFSLQSAPATHPADIFGSGSYIPDVRHTPSHSEPSLADNPVYAGFSIVITVAYLFIMFRRGREATNFFRLLFGKKSASSSEEHIYPRTRILNPMSLLAFFAVAIAAVKIIDVFWDRPGLDPQAWFVVGAVPVIALTMLVIYLLQYLFLRLAGTVTQMPELVKNLQLIRLVCLSVGGAVLTPLVILLSFSGGTAAYWLAWPTIGVAAGCLLLFVCKTFVYFVRQKVSILFWILYLCTVETMPPMIVILASVRQLSSLL